MSDDPFDMLRLPHQSVRPPAGFVARLRNELTAALGLDTGPVPEPPTVSLPPRRSPMPTLNATAAADAVGTEARLTPYLAVHDGAAALAFYTSAFGATETMRVTGDDGRLGHAELLLGPARIYLSDEYPEIGVLGPRTLGGTAVSLHLEVADVDRAFAAALEAGAIMLAPPADQPHGSRHGTLVDPFGHRWMLSQTIEEVPTADYDQRLSGSGFSATAATAAAGDGSGAQPSPARDGDGIWAGVVARDAQALIGFLVEVFGFEARLVVPGEEPGVVEHSQIRWPEGGLVMVGSADRPDNVFSQRPVGNGNLYVVTADPDRVYQRCLAAGATIVLEPAAADYDPDGMMFTAADPEGNLWTFGTYAGDE